MSKPIEGNTYLYRTITGRVYHVDIVKAGCLFSLCRWRVDNIDFGYSYDKARYKLNWGIIHE